MKKILFGLLSCFALNANSQTYNFTTAGVSGMNGPDQAQINAAYAVTNLNGSVTINTQGIQEWVVPYTGTYQIQAIGASGGNSTWGATVLGGNGSNMTGEFNLTAGQIIQILVGQTGESAAVGGGGGASYVAILNAPQIVAGGGGGASSDQAGVSSVVTNDGTYCSMNVTSGGTFGNGGDACTVSDNNAGGGGGFFTNGVTPNTGPGNNNGFGGFSFLNGGIGGQPGNLGGACTQDAWGGFGGGGSTSCNTVGAGGGGGYSGGAGGQHYGNCGGGSIRAGGGGGGSYNIGSNQTNIAGSNIGDGSVVITVLCSPTTITADLLALNDVIDECSSMPTPPTATNDCGASIIGIPDVAMPVISQGTTLVTWTFDDGQGNSTTQTQNVILTDITAPVADSTSLPDLSDMCNVTSVIAPTATDNCAGQITGTTTTTFPVSTTGPSIITWTFNDGQGNTSTQTQNILNGAIDNGIVLDGSQLNATALVAAYQWLNCDNNFTPLPAEVNQFYDATITGTYAVEITQGGCVDTSACVLVDFTAISELDIQSINIYPNPTFGTFTISASDAIESIEILDLLGRTVKVPMSLIEGTVNASALENGNYMVVVTTQKGIFTRELTILN